MGHVRGFGHGMFTGGRIMKDEVKYYTEPEWINKKPSTIGSWTRKDMSLYQARSRAKSGRTISVKAMLKRLAKQGVKV